MELLQLSGFLICWSDDMELTTKIFTRSCPHYCYLWMFVLVHRSNMPSMQGSLKRKKHHITFCVGVLSGCNKDTKFLDLIYYRLRTCKRSNC